MTGLEQLLHDAMTEHAETVSALRPGAARDAVRRASRVRHLHQAAAATATVAVVGAGAGVIGTLGQMTHGVPGASTVSSFGSAATAASSRPMAPSPSPTTGVEDHTPIGKPSAELVTVTLPDPAPGFPLRRHSDGTARASGADGHVYWTRLFLLGRTLPTSRTLPGGAIEETPTGPEATVQVIDGPAPASPDAHGRIGNQPVIGSRTVDGHAGYLTQDSGTTKLYFSTGRFSVTVGGSNGTTADELVTLAEAIQGLR